ncbi:MAG: Tex family protein [Acidobacteriota bacterium]|nr:Tex family protein [Acidobacteriota bacterium]
MNTALESIHHTISRELSVKPHQVKAAVDLLDEGATVPFIARYRKEWTGGLDDTQLRSLQERLVYLREMEERRETILASIGEQGKLTPQLEKSIREADTKTRLEDLYLPFKPKRRTKAQIAREAGLGPLANRLLRQPHLDPEGEAARFVNPDKGVADTNEALEGARAVLVEEFGEDADLLGRIREHIARRGFLCARVAKGKQEEGKTYRDYFDYSEKLARVPSHRALAMLRGRKEGILKLDVAADHDHLNEPKKRTRCEEMIARRFRIKNHGRPADSWLEKTVQVSWKQKIHPHLENEAVAAVRERAETEAVKVFARNLEDLLMAAPAGSKATLGLDPGLRTGVKVAVVDGTGKLTATDTIYPHKPRNWWRESIKTLVELCKRHQVKLIAIGNGTGSRETDKLAAELIQRHPEMDLQKVMVSEAGASVYSASELAAQEFPELDVSLRGAVSIARRLQDPLAELVKIDPKSIGVGQYQHDLNQSSLAGGLDAVVEDCVNRVGVDANTASIQLLTRVSGLSKTLAGNIVGFRDSNGRFRDRKTLMKVPRMGAKSFEQCAGFLRITDGVNPLDGSAVHPEAYPVVQRIARNTGKALPELIGNTALLKSLKPADFTDDRFGIPTITDILAELDKPGRDPRGDFQTAAFREGVEELEDLEPGMTLEGVVTNVTNFGAFVDVGVHQDGLVHISQLANHFVRDPHDVVKAGDVVTVRVQEVDLDRRRIALTMKL